MRSWLKRIRGAVGVGVTWATGWGLFGGLYWLVLTGSELGVDLALSLGSQYAALGFVGGVTFSAVLRLTEGRRRFDELRIPRFAAWGGFGGLLIGAAYTGVLTALGMTQGPGMAAALAQFVGITTVLGASCAGGSLAIARVSDDMELLESGEESAEVGLSSEERRTLLGDPDTVTS